MQRSFISYLTIVLKGIAMGAADIVPGVSGGTIAFISGIYEELITSISKLNFGLFSTLKNKGIVSTWKQLNGGFLLALFTGIGIGVVSLSKLVGWLLINQPILLWAFFFGLVIASVFFVLKQITKFSTITILILLIGVIVGYYVTIIPPNENTSEGLWFLFFAGALAICAMILPGISGAFILVLLGVYQDVLQAINIKNVKIIAIVGAGAVIGLLSFSKILKWTFANFRNQTLAILTGFIIGSLNKIWPWKETLSWQLDSHGKQIPLYTKSILPTDYNGEPQIVAATAIAVLGFGLIIILDKFATKKHSV